MKKTFDAVGWMRKKRIEIDRDTEGLSWEERSQYIINALQGDPLWERIKDRTLPTANQVMAEHAATARETPVAYSSDKEKLH
jgi:hypothetical protein